MSFFDTILKLTEDHENTATVLHRESSSNAYQGSKTGENEENQKYCTKNETNRLPAANLSREKTSSRPEKLSFLRPCPICHGRNFIYGAAGGFFCVVCQPGIQGQPVEATGPERPQAEQKREGQGGDFSSSASWIEREKISDQDLENFTAAWPILKEIMPALIAAGWSRAALLCRRRHRGSRGIAWFPVWRKPGLSVDIGQHGELVFTFPSGNQEIRQTAWPDVSFFQRPIDFQMESSVGVRNARGTRPPGEDPS
jgi:hypothetical protein